MLKKLNPRCSRSLFRTFSFYFFLFFFSDCICATNCENVSLNDETLIRSCHYENGFQVIVASNKEFEDSAVSLMVKSGYFNDPADKIGLAHLIEHTFHHAVESKNFLEKLYSNNGRYFARTAGFFTQYDFSVPHEQLNWILRNIASFLLNATFEPFYLTQELKVIEEEQKEYNNNYAYQILNILKNYFDSNHPLKRVMPIRGHNLSLKGDSLSNDVTSYFKTQYGPENLILVVATKKNVEEVVKNIEKVMKPLLSNVHKEGAYTNRRPKVFDSNVPSRIFIPKQNNDDSLTYLYPIYNSYDFLTHKTFDLIYFFFRLEGEGGLKNKLINEGFITDLEIDTYPFDANQLIMSINFSLTEKGKEGISLIEKEYQKYLKFILSQKKKMPYFIDICFKNKINNLLANNDAGSFLGELIYPLQINPGIQTSYITSLQDAHDNNIYIYNNVYNIINDIFQTKPYTVIYSDPDFFDKLQKKPTSVSVMKSLKNTNNDFYNLPQVNIEPEKEKIESNISKGNWISPTLIHSSPNFKIWHKTCDPKQNYSNISFLLNFSSDFEQDQEIILNKILSKDLSLRLGNLRDAFYFTNSDIQVKSLENGGVFISSIMPTSFQSSFIREVEKIFKSIQLSNDRFDKLYNLIMLDLEAEQSSLSYHDIKKIVQKVLRTSLAVKVLPIKNSFINYQQAVKFYKQISDCFITFLIHGEYSEENAKAISFTISSAIHNIKTHSDKNANIRQLPLWKSIEPGRTWVKIPMTGQNGSLLILNIQLIDNSPKSLAKLYLLRSYLEHTFFDYFRSLEFPYYTAEVHSFEQGLQFVIFSDDKDESVLIKELSTFIDHAKNKISYFRFRKIRNQYLVSTWFERLSFKDLTNEYWRDIIYSEYGVNHRKKVRMAANSISYKDFKNFYNDFLINESNKRVLVITNIKEML